MTSNLLVCKHIRNQIKQQSLWLFVTALLAALATGLLKHIMIIPGSNDFRTYDKYESYSNFFSFSQIMIFFCAVGLLAGVVRFRYLHSQKKVDFYHSQPVSITSRFLTAIVVDTLCVVAALLINYVTDILFVLQYNPHGTDLILIISSGTAAALLAFWAGYAMTSLATILTNNTIYTAIFSGIVIFVPAFLASALNTLINTSMKHLDDPNFINDDDLMFSNPLTWLTNCCQCFYTFVGKSYYGENVYKYELSPKEACINVLIELGFILGYFILSYFALRFRSNERKSLATPFPWLKYILQTLVMLTGLCFSRELGLNLFTKNRTSTLTIFSLLAALGLYFVITFVTDLNTQAFKKRGNIVAAMVGLFLYLASLAACNFDIFGWDHYVPTPNQIASVKLSFAPNNRAYDDDDHYYYDRCAMIQLIDIPYNDFQATCSMAKQLLATEKQAEKDLSSKEGNYYKISIEYTLKDGSHVFRTYDTPITTGTPFKEIFDSEEYHRNAAPFLSNPNYVEDCYDKHLYLDFSFPVSKLSKRKAKEIISQLVEAYNADIAEHGEPSYYTHEEWDTIQVYANYSFNYLEKHPNANMDLETVTTLLVPDNFQHTKAFLANYDSDN